MGGPYWGWGGEREGRKMGGGEGTPRGSWNKKGGCSFQEREKNTGGIAKNGPFKRRGEKI